MVDSVKHSNDDRMQKRIWFISLIFAIIMLALEWVYFMSYDLNELRYMSKMEYALRYILVPETVNAAALIGVGYVLFKKKLTCEIRNWLALFLMFIETANASLVHYIFIPVIMAMVVAIFFSSAFGDGRITGVLTFLSVVVAILSMIKFYNKHMLTDFYFWGTLIVMIIFIIAVGVLTGTLNKHTNHLLMSISDSYIKQENLAGELLIEPMTGLYNRKAYNERIEMVIENCAATGEKSYIAIFDIDHFKQVNDTYGHGNGDIVLKALANMLKDKTKNVGQVFRYGGEEFVIIFSNEEPKKILNLIEDIRTGFRCYRFNFMNKDGITVSCGVAEYKKGESSASWFNRADTALYKAKETGRNKTIVSD